MASVKRIFVEKKPGFDIEAKNALADFRENLSISALSDVRIIVRYDVEGLDEEDFAPAVENVLSEPAADIVYYEELAHTDGEYAFAVEYLPGQYDQRADSAAECIALLTMKARPTVTVAKMYLLNGYLSAADIEAIKNYVINPVDSREARLDKPETLELNLAQPDDVEVVKGFITLDETAMDAFRTKGGYAMSLADLLFTQAYFKGEGRDPFITELKVIDTYWSDHCRHTTFLTELTEIEFEEGPVGAKVREVYSEYLKDRKEVYGERERPITLMDMATIYPKAAKRRGELAGLDESEEINACSIKHRLETEDGEEDYLIMFKNETHNHPTEIEPFGGAATCLGGAIRDPLSGRSYVYQAMRVTGSGDPRERTEDTMEFKLPQRKITRGAAEGYSSYGNQIGLATGLVRELYHPGYKAKRMEIGAVIGAAPAKNVVRERPAAGDKVILIGGRTGRDGIGGATGSSKAHDETSTAECGAEVQKGNAPTERKLQRLFRNPKFTTLVKRCNDFGAGGVSVAIGELAESLDIYLDRVPKKYEGLDGTELAISESQERMAVVVEAADVDSVLACADEENLEATLVAEITDTGSMRMFWRDNAIVDIKRSFLDTNGAAQYAKAFVGNPEIKGLLEVEAQGSLDATLKEILGDLNVCSQKGLIERFDATVGRGTVLMPFGGKRQMTPTQAMAALVPVFGNAMSKDASLMSYGLDPYLMEKSPFHGAVYSVLSSIAKVVAAGGDYKNVWLTFQEYFESLGEAPERWGKPIAALLGAFYAQKGFGAASIGGKDSMSGTFRDIHVPPTLCSFAVAMEKEKNVLSPEFKQAGNNVYLLDLVSDQFSLPVFEAMCERYSAFHELVVAGRVKSAYAIEEGGILAAVSKMALGNGVGLAFDDAHSLMELVRKQYGAIIFETAETLDGEYYEFVGKLTNCAKIALHGEAVSLDAIEAYYTEPLESVFPTQIDQGELPSVSGIYEKRSTAKPRTKLAKPRVIIPTFPGTNGEYDAAQYFEREGAVAEVIVIRNLTPAAIEESVAHLANRIDEGQIIMLPGGFSGGDEPDGSGKFIATIFRNPRVADAVNRFLKERDGLMFGVCNGFQALIKLGLVPYGEIRPMREDSPTLTFNAIGRHISNIANTRVTSVNSPWLAHTEVGDMHAVAVSHGEGRFVCSEEELKVLFENGQIATRYCDLQGNPSMDITVTPNGSFAAVEGLLSPDGRVFGKMGHTERYAPGLWKNVPGEKEPSFARAGVEYFL